MAKAHKQYEDDDGRVIANMNVEGMPWYAEHTAQDKSIPGTDRGQNDLSRKETIQIILGALKAGLLLAGIFSAALILYVLFCTKVWLRA